MPDPYGYSGAIPGGLLSLLAMKGNQRNPQISRPSEQRGSSIWDRLALLYAGPRSPLLSQEQNKQAQQQALLQAGLMALLASSGQPGGPTPHLFSILAQSALAGQQGGMNARQQMVQQNRAAQLQQVMQAGGGLSRDMLDQMIMQALGAGDMETARMLVEVRKVMKDSTANQVPRQYRDAQGNLRLGVYDPETRSFTPIEGASPASESAGTPREVVDAEGNLRWGVLSPGRGFIDPVTNEVIPGAQPPRNRVSEVAFTQTTQLIKEFRQAIDPYREFSESYARMKRAVVVANAPNDVALLTAFMKLVDEGSVVREAEFRVAQAATSWFERAKAQLARAGGSDKFLTDETRAQFLRAADEFAYIAARTSRELTLGFQELFEDYGLSVPRLIQDPMVRQNLVPDEKVKTILGNY